MSKDGRSKRRGGRLFVLCDELTKLHLETVVVSLAGIGTLSNPGASQLQLKRALMAKCMYLKS